MMCGMTIRPIWNCSQNRQIIFFFLPPHDLCSRTLLSFNFHFLVQSARLREKAENKEADGEDEESDEDEIEEELGFISPLDSVNPYASFKQALTSCVAFVFLLSLHN